MLQKIWSYFTIHNEEKLPEQVLKVISEPELPKHPYYPTDLKLPNFTEKTYSTEYLIGVFAAAAITITLVSFSIISQKRNVSGVNKVAFVWLIITGSIHIFFEGYFTYSHKTIQSDNFLFAQMWKEYSLSDSRYMTSDSFVVNMEGITAVCIGPTAYLSAIGILQNWPSRHVLQLITSLGQLYGLVLYYATTLLEGFPHSRPEPLYFWVYFFGINFIWVLIPGALFLQSCLYLTNTVREDQKKKSKKTN
ncbi:11419_t:CDS:2 [Funneliformis geosporum]|uniref:13268_t:CDS:1 n=1 Tax=Funneliformis geosporum TaxID=1117311 RepID=A0A9W4SUJ4_9GLOM|nr:13268_t:CDS:2 [Funneliformis geosporum]CAI2182058.1 11419_t:CDS:2 [Funneliformis geosporum]